MEAYMEARILTRARRELSLKEIEDFAIGMFEGCKEKHIIIFGFYYIPYTGIYTVGPRDELEKFKNSDIEDFDFVKEMEKLDMFWLIDWTGTSPKLNRMIKE